MKRGDIYYVNNIGGRIGSEQHAGRPAIIVSNDRSNERSGTVEVVFCTTKPKCDSPTHVTVRSTYFPSTALCEQITTVSKERLGRYVGTCTETEMSNLGTAIEISLGIGEHAYV